MKFICYDNEKFYQEDIKMENTKEKIEYIQKEREFLREKAIEELQQILYTENFEKVERELWKTLLLFEDFTFHTAKGLNYFYKIKGYEIFFSRKEKSVTRASVGLALKKAIEMQKEGIRIKGPKMLKSFGASYIYPVFIQIGVIKSEVEKPL